MRGLGSLPAGCPCREAVQLPVPGAVHRRERRGRHDSGSTPAQNTDTDTAPELTSVLRGSLQTRPHHHQLHPAFTGSTVRSTRCPPAPLSDPPGVHRQLHPASTVRSTRRPPAPLSHPPTATPSTGAPSRYRLSPGVASDPRFGHRHARFGSQRGASCPVDPPGELSRPALLLAVRHARPAREQHPETPTHTLTAAGQGLITGATVLLVYYGFQTVCKCPFRALLVTSATDSNQTWTN